MSRRDPLERLRALCLALPEAHEAEAWGEPTFRVRNKLFATYAGAGTHHGGKPPQAGRPAAWVKAAPSNQALLVQADGARYFVPPYVGVKGWVGVYLDGPPGGGGPDWDALADLLRDAYRRTAPKRLAAALDGPAAPVRAPGGA